MSGPFNLGHCPACGDPLLATFNEWARDVGVYRHRAVHVGDEQRELEGLPLRECSWAEPMAVAERELSRDIADGIREGKLSLEDIVRDCRPAVVAHVYRFLNPPTRADIFFGMTQ